MGNKWTRWEQKYEKPKAYYQYSVKNGVSKEEAKAAVDYAKATGQNPKNVTPKSQLKSSSCSSSSSSCSSSGSSCSSSSSSCSKNSSIFNTTSTNNKKNVNPKDIVRTGNPEQDAKNFAKKMGISYNEAKETLQNLFGTPQQKSDSTSDTTSDTNNSSNSINNNNILMLLLNLFKNLMSYNQ